MDIDANEVIEAQKKQIGELCFQVTILEIQGRKMAEALRLISQQNQASSEEVIPETTEVESNESS